MQPRRGLREAAGMKPIRRILVAVKDPQARALPAVNKAAQIAKGLDAQLTLFHDIATPLYAEALYTTGVVAASTAEMERQFQRLIVEFNGSAWADDALLRLAQLNFVLIYAVVGLGLMLLAGFTGQFSIGHAAFLGTGAYTQGVLVNLGVPFPLAMVVDGSEVVASILGCMAAGIECEKDGNIPISKADVLRKIDAVEKLAHLH